ncbi:hypothetical protein [Actinoplanes sp. NPDC049681]|uniref:hypothetical protein n=1 Tax=Actinoplanes sp. NPDC049681 TaxID=3363905 RepID=UPI0037879B52
MSLVRTFLPWWREGLAVTLGDRPPAGRSRAALPISVRLRESPLDPVRLPFEFAGPGDVAGLDPAEILRTEPYDGCPGFEPAFFPYVELASPDLPWRFTPFGPATKALPDPEGGPGSEQNRLQPWLALVVVPAERATVDPAAPGRLPVLACDAAELPDPAELWAWAHVQLTHDAGAAPEDAPTRVARLLCPRRLQPETRYLAGLVPTFAAGRSSLVPGPAPADPLAPAWPAAGDVRLPVFFQWSFATGTAGSFEALVRRLRPFSAPADASGRRIALDAPGWSATGTPGSSVLMQGALRPLGSAEPELDDPTIEQSLRAAVSTSGPGVQLRPPLYGQDYQGGATVVPVGPGWLAEINSDPRRRVAAGLGSWAVAVHQDELVEDAWQQLAAARAAQPPAGDPALAEAVTGAVRRRSTGDATTAPATADRFAPKFDRAGYTLLRAVAQEWLLPGVGDLPPDSVSLVSTNGAFAESVLLGINHALARELMWRRYPLDTTTLMVDRFWDAGTVDPVAGWSSTDRLGSHGPAADNLVLLLRGELMRRYPGAALYLERAGERRDVILAGTIGTDVAFFGFPLTPAQARDGWFAVLEEPPAPARFGLDDPGGTALTAPPPTWPDLDWSHPQVAGRSYVPVAGPLAGIRRPAGATAAVWGADSANLAVITQQPAFRLRVPIALWLPPAG